MLQPSSADGGAGDGHQHLGSTGTPWPSRHTPASRVALPAGLVPHPRPSTFLLPLTCPAGCDLWDTQICSRFGITSSLGRTHKPVAPLQSSGTFGYVNGIFALELTPFSPALSHIFSVQSLQFPNAWKCHSQIPRE